MQEGVRLIRPKVGDCIPNEHSPLKEAQASTGGFSFGIQLSTGGDGKNRNKISPTRKLRSLVLLKASDSDVGVGRRPCRQGIRPAPTDASHLPDAAWPVGQACYLANKPLSFPSSSF